MPDVPAPTGLAGSRCLPESVLQQENEQACLPGALDAKYGMSPTGMSPLPSREESEPVSPSCPIRPMSPIGPVHPRRIRKRPQYLEDFVC